MAQKTNKENEEKVVVNEEQPCCCCSKSKLKTSTILVSALVAGAIAIWAVAANNWLRLPGFSNLTNDGKVIATVDGEPVYMTEVEQLVAHVPQLAELPFEDIYPQLVKDVVAEKVLKKAVEGSDIENNPAVQQRINAILFEAYLVDKFTKTVTDDDLKTIYLEQIKNFPRQDEIRARHILVKTEKEAKDILVQLKAGADFKMLANTKSLDAGSNNGGDLGYFRKDMMIPAFTEPVFGLKVGQLSAPIKTSFGWHIVLVEDRRLAAPPAFEEMKEFLRKQVFQQKVPELIAQEHDRFGAEVLVPSLKEDKPATTVEEASDMSLEPDVEEASPKTEADTPVVADEEKPTQEVVSAEQKADEKPTTESAVEEKTEPAAEPVAEAEKTEEKTAE